MILFYSLFILVEGYTLHTHTEISHLYYVVLVLYGAGVLNDPEFGWARASRSHRSPWRIVIPICENSTNPIRNFCERRFCS